MTVVATDGGAALLVEGRMPLRSRRAVGAVLRAAGDERRPLGRWRFVPRTDGPHVALGVLWGIALGGSLWLGPLATAVLFALAAAAAALQAAGALRRAARQRWRRLGRASAGRPVPLVAGVAAALLPLAAVVSGALAGALVLTAVVASVGVAAIRSARVDALALVDGGETIRAWLAIGLAAAAPVVLVRTELVIAIVVLALACTFDVGDYLVGSAASNGVEGPLAGMVGVAVVTFGLAVAQPGTLTVDEIWLLGVLAAVGCPLGQVLGSAILPRADAFAPALRRLDTLLLVGPLSLLVLR